MTTRQWLLGSCCLLLLAGCGSVSPPRVERSIERPVVSVSSQQAQEVVLYALSLLDVDYRFGGKNPAQGLDCSGMVSYIYRHAAGVQLPHNAAQIARMGRDIERRQLQPGDLVFFNTRNQPYSHVGLYIGDDRFVHAPSSNGKIRVDRLSAGYYAQRFEGARSFAG